MNLRNLSLSLLSFFAIALASCEKNTMSKIPQIGFINMSSPVIRINRDVDTLNFTFQDGDADLGLKDPNGKDYDIYIKDFRYDTGYVGYFFPADIDPEVENPKKGVIGTCAFAFTPDILLTRTDSIHMRNGDTTHFEVYIVDRAGNHSNHIVTSEIIMVP